MTFFGCHPASLSGLLVTRAGMTSREEIRENPDENLHPPIRLRTVTLGQKGSLGHDFESLSRRGFMPKSKALQGVRSGRINAPGTDPIIVTANETTYRFSNTGRDPFTVKYSADGANVEAEIKKNSSVDFRIPEDVSVFVVSGATPAVGVFEVLKRGQPVRAGRFKGTNPILITKRRKGELYRIFNGSDVPFDTAPTTGSVIQPKCSRDVVIPQPELKIVPGAERATGAFEVVDPTAELRSGRFQFKGVAGGLLESVIIDLTTSDSIPDQSYRITNSGDDPFEVWLATRQATLATDQSIDLQISKGAVVKIKTEANKTVAGIYDSL